MFLAQRPSARRILVTAALGLAASCAGGGGGVIIGGPPPGPPHYGEIEPNDSPWSADFLGGVHGATHFIVEGHVEGWPGFDLYDHFELSADEPVGIEFILYGDDPFADLDLYLFDPDSGQIVGGYDGPWNPEEGFFTIDWAGKSVVLVVESATVDTTYSLEIRGVPWHFGPGSEGEPGAEAQRRPAAEDSGTGISFPFGGALRAAEQGDAAPGER